MPASFEHAFDRKLHPYGPASPREFIYQSSPGSCEWYTQVHINTNNDLKISEGMRVRLGMGAIAQPLMFGGPHGMNHDQPNFNGQVQMVGQIIGRHRHHDVQRPGSASHDGNAQRNVVST